jgi:hypothetical protein
VSNAAAAGRVAWQLGRGAQRTDVKIEHQIGRGLRVHRRGRGREERGDLHLRGRPGGAKCQVEDDERWNGSARAIAPVRRIRIAFAPILARGGITV